MVGSSMIDLISRAPRLPEAGETLIGSEFKLGYGGKGANQAVMAARLGASVTAVTRLGRDVFGEGTLKNYRDQGIDTTYITFDDEKSSGVAPIWVDEATGQNRIIIVPGANHSLRPADVRAARSAILESGALMCQLEILPETTLEAFRIARENLGVVKILNPAPAGPMPDELLQLTDILVPNETETALLTGMPVNTLGQAGAAAQALLKRGPRAVIITLGERGALLVAAGEPPVHAPAASVQAVDTTGAGDAFVGSLAYFVARGLLLSEAVRRATTIATRSVLKQGTQTSFPTRDEIHELLA